MQRLKKEIQKLKDAGFLFEAHIEPRQVHKAMQIQNGTRSNGKELLWPMRGMIHFCSSSNRNQWLNRVEWIREARNEKMLVRAVSNDSVVLY